MRCTQIAGLSKEALNYLVENGKKIIVSKCPHCEGPLMEDFEEKEYDSAADYGMFDDGPELFEYTMKDGSKVREIVQAVPWSSGPVIFLCLEDENGNRIGEWSEEEIRNA